MAAARQGFLVFVQKLSTYILWIAWYFGINAESFSTTNDIVNVKSGLISEGIFTLIRSAEMFQITRLFHFFTLITLGWKVEDSDFARFFWGWEQSENTFWD